MTQLLDALAISFDLPILDWIQAHMQCGFLDFIMPIITMFGDGGVFWIAWAVLLLFFRKHRSTGAAMGVALLMGLVICNMILKPIVGRIRPFDFQELHFQKEIIMLLDKSTIHDFSFPSGHTIASFEASVVLMLRNKKMGIPALILAVLVAFSRLYLYVHYPSDVIVSMILGTCFAFLANAIVNRVEPKLTAKGKFAK